MGASMRNLLLTIAYLGTRFHGFQVQNNAVTVAQVLQDAMESVMGSRDDIKGCSRTDSGVHAEMFCVSVKTECRIPCENLVKALNVKLPPDVAVKSCREVPESFHARYNCRGKRYEYRIHNALNKDPFHYKAVLEHPYPLDVEKLDREAKDFIGEHDFSSFCAAKSSVQDMVREVYDCGLYRQGELVTFYVEGNGFLYNMVRIMVGTLLGIASGTIPESSIPAILAAKNRSAAGATAPAWGLYLTKVFYNETDLIL